MNQAQLAEMAGRADFKARIQYLMIKAAIAKLNTGTPSQEDILLGQRILNEEEPVHAWSLAALTNPTIAAGAHQIDGSTIVDGDLEFSVNSCWVAFSK